MIARPLQAFSKKTFEAADQTFDCDVFSFGPPARLWITSEDRIPAGTFTTDHFRVDDTVDLYINGPDAIMVRFQWIPADRDYVLTCLETGQ